VGLDPAGGAELAAARFTAWLETTRTRWLVVLDDLRDACDVAGLWPAGQAGITLITAGCSSAAGLAELGRCGLVGHGVLLAVSAGKLTELHAQR
jgi:hypothetical protein